MLEAQYAKLLNDHGKGIYSCLAQNKKDVTFLCSSWITHDIGKAKDKVQSLAMAALFVPSFVQLIPKVFFFFMMPAIYTSTVVFYTYFFFFSKKKILWFLILLYIFVLAFTVGQSTGLCWTYCSP